MSTWELGPGEGTWSCMVCHVDRPDAAISVAHRPAKGLESWFPDTHVNVRYCNDKVACASVARATGPWDLASSSHTVPVKVRLPMKPPTLS